MDTDTLNGLNIVFPIYNEDRTPFHNLVLRKSVVDSIVMSLGDKITGDVFYKDNTLQVTMKEYVEYNGIHFSLVNPPTIVREGMVADNGELKGMTKYSFEFYHPMYQLSNFPFTDVATKTGEEKYLSQNKIFSWIGKPQDYIDKLNKNLQGTVWYVRKSDRFPVEKDDELSDVQQFDNVSVAEAIKRGYEIWGTPYIVSQLPSDDPLYAQGKHFVVEYGLPSNEIYESESARQLDTPYVFQMGQGVGLKNNSRTPRNNKIVTRIAGYGSEDNVPYGYPQIVWTGNQDWDYTINNDPNNPLSYPIYKGIVGGQYVKLIKHPFTRTHLMPSIFTETVNKKVNPNAVGYDPTIEIKDYYDAIATQEYPYVNEINLQAPSYESHEFADIKPELDADRNTGIVSAVPLNADLTPADHWDDSMDDDGNYLQSYFQITLPRLSFDLYACAAITQEMQINMRSGACIGCTFPVQVDWDDYKRNFYDEDGNFVPDGEQRDLTKYPKSNLGQISVVVQKDNSTFGTLMPNIYQQPKANDLFVFIGISLPLSYIANAEERLDDAMKTYMLENNAYYFDYPLKFDEHFLATHTYILEQIRPNSIIHFNYGGVEQRLFVKQLTVKYGNAPLPQYDITLTDNVDVVLNQIGQVADDVDRLSTLISILRQSYSRNVWSELAKKLSKVSDDTAQGVITFQQGLKAFALSIFNGIKNTGRITSDEADIPLFVSDTTIQGNINASGDANIGRQVDSRNVKTDVVQSHNYTGEGFADTGYRLTSDDGTGSSALTVDNLHVRKKATFEELEVKKETAIAGNQVYSCAANVITRTDYYNGSGEIIGYSKIKSPWLLKGLALVLGKRAANFKLFGRYKTVRVYLPDASQINYVRCYFLAKDGDREVENMWQAGKKDGVRWYNHGNDLARCQTMNLKNSNRKTYISNVGEYKLGNVYWWRKVINVSSQPVTIDGQEYHYFDVSMGDCDAGSDIPAAGDHVVQFGNDSDPDRMNLIVLEVNGGDAPAEKFYEGIHNYNLNDCYYGGHTIKTRLSPKAGYKFQGSKFEIVTEYAVSPVPIERGEWVSGTTYYYYDLVQHNGATWLCVASTGNVYTVVEDIKDDYTVVYPKGTTLNQTKYNALTVSQKMLCTRTSTGSTTLEPTEANSSVWRYYAEKGNGIVSITRTFAISNVNTTASETTEPAHQGSWSVNSPAVTEQYPYLWAKEVVVYTDTTKNTTKYYFVGGRGDNGIDAQDVEWAYVRTTTKTAPTIVAGSGTDYWKQDDFLPKAKVSNGRIKGDTEAGINVAVQCTDDPQGVDFTWKYEWEIKRTKGEATNGHREWNNYTPGKAMTIHNNLSESFLVTDIDNDADQFGTDSEGAVITQQKRSTIVSMYYGTQKQAFSSAPTTVLKYDDGTPASGNVPTTVATVSVTKIDDEDYKIEVTIKTSTGIFNTHNGMYVDITGTCSYGTQTMRFSLERVKSGAKGVDPVIYQLAPTQKTFSFSRDASNNLTPSSQSSKINVAKTEGNTTTILSSAQTGITYKWGYDDSTTAQETGKAVGTSISISNTIANSHNSVWVELSTGDRETLPIVKDGTNGANGNGIVSITTTYARSSQSSTASETTAPTIDGSWSSTMPTLTDTYKYLWRREVTTYTDTSKNTTKYFLAAVKGQEGVNGKDGWMVTADPANVIITQSLGTNTTSFSTQAVTFSAKKGNNDATVTSVLINNTTDSKTKWYRFKGSVSGTTVTVSSPQPSGDSYYTEGYFTARVTVTDPDSNNPILFYITVPCYANLLGTWKEKTVADTKTAIARSTLYEFTGDSGVSRTEKLGEFIASSKKYETKLTSKVVDEDGNIVKTSGSLYEQTSELISLSVESKENINLVSDPDIYQMLNDGSVTRDISLVEGRTYTLTARLKNISSASATCNITINTTPAVTLACSLIVGEEKNFHKTFTPSASDNYTLTVLQRADVLLEWLQIEQGSSFTKHDNIGSAFQRTGIDIENGLIKATTDNFVICNSSGTQTFSVDSDGNLVSSGSAKFSGTIEAKGGTIGGFSIGEHKINSSNNKIVLNDDGTATIGGLLVTGTKTSFNGEITAQSGGITGNFKIGENKAHQYYFEFKPKERAGGTGSYNYYSAQLNGYDADNNKEIFSIKMGVLSTIGSAVIGYEPVISIRDSFINSQRFMFKTTISSRTYTLDGSIYTNNANLFASAYNQSGVHKYMYYGIVDGVCTLSANSGNGSVGWPTSASEVEVGGVYMNSNGYLVVRRS